MKCPSCGADIAPGDARCSHCGSHPPAAARTTRASVFARVKASEAYQQRNSPERLARLPNVAGIQKAFMIVFFAFFIGSSGFMAVMALAMAGAGGWFGSQAGGVLGVAFMLAPLFMTIVPIGFVVLGVMMFRKTKQKMDSLEHDPVNALPVVVVDKRTEVSGGGNSSASTSYFITCEGEDGDRQEYQVWDGKLYGRLTADDAGILYLRAGYGLDFDRVAT